MTKITDLGPAAIPLDPTDLVEVVQNVGGTAVNKKVAVGDLLAGGAWTAYTPSWTGASGNPAIVDGTLAGAYRLDANTLFLRIRIAMGPSTTYGSGTWSLALPAGVTAKGGELIGSAYDASAAIFRPVGMSFYDGATAVNVFGASAFVSSTSPFTWANGDALSLSGVIEVQ